MNANIKQSKPKTGSVTIEFTPHCPDEKYTDNKKRSVLKIIFQGFERKAAK